eukprot:12902225-Prorocentrum_lima.AAC.1
MGPWELIQEHLPSSIDPNARPKHMGEVGGGNTRCGGREGPWRPTAPCASSRTRHFRGWGSAARRLFV